MNGDTNTGTTAECSKYWEIPHPGTLQIIRCATFTEAMDKWFEGFNVPVLVQNGLREDFSQSCERVRHCFEIRIGLRRASCLYDGQAQPPAATPERKTKEQI